MSVAKFTSSSDLTVDLTAGFLDSRSLEACCIDTAESAAIEEAIAPVLTGDFHSKWDSARSFSKQFAHWENLPVPHLIGHLNSSEDPENQWFLIRMLGRYDHPVVVETLASFLVTTPIEELQLEATRALTQLGESAIATLTYLLTNTSTEKRILAARTLSKIRRSDVIEPLLSVTDSPELQLRAVAIEALGSFHDPRVTPVLLKAIDDAPAIAVEAIRALGRRADLLNSTDLVGLLQQGLFGEEAAVAKESAIALGRLGTKDCAIALGQFITQPAPSEVKNVAVRALGWFDHPTATLYLTTAFDCPMPLVMPAVKQEIARSLGQTRSSALKHSAVKPLVAWLEGAGLDPLESISFKQSVISALSRLGLSEAVDSLIPLLGDSDARIRMHVVSALKQIAPRTGLAQARQYLSSAEASNSLSMVSKQDIESSLVAW